MAGSSVRNIWNDGATLARLMTATNPQDVQSDDVALLISSTASLPALSVL